ncbi:beta-lactamase [Flavobacterium akiainvivens]|uniref:Beta-lactamase n=1 Tax=Flavobacterium akiainvivens TaxID=1202724 RepID=A0A0M8MCN6_9FLAO|nr:serine hydrolase [Flavobacterium akiainvivens]KOS07405.1 beta-lactamase [Flavobacterium akiainvivens]SFQ47740.1 CubicO group peptidase, beta-lactamase class C family [Flavobacterium akiainvivens]
MKKILLLALLVAMGKANAQDTRAQKIDSLFTSLAAKGQFNGNVLIAEKGNVLYKKSFGLRDEAAKLPLNDTSIFELASVSKQFTAMGIVLLEQKGKLKYDDPIVKYIPELGFYKGVTIRQLLNHTGGLPDYMQLIGTKGDTTKINTNKDIITLFAKEKPEADFTPGSKFEYSNTGYALLASIIEKASGKTYAMFLADNIFKPLKMENTFVYNRRLAPKKVENYAYGYVYDANGKKLLPDNDPDRSYVICLDGIVGDGTVNSTTVDLLKWDRALYTDKLASKKSLELVFTPPVLPNDEKTKYAFGWIIDASAEYGKVTAHSGGWPGYVNYIERHIDNDKTIIVLQNNENGMSFLKNVRRLLYGKAPEVVKDTQTEITLTEAQLTPFVGEYELEPGFNMEMTLDNGQLYTQIPGQEKFPVFAESENTFFLKVVKAQLVFEKDSTGTVINAILKQNGNEFVVKKVK